MEIQEISPDGTESSSLPVNLEQPSETLIDRSPPSYRFFEVKLELFDGPIDLLLHLVQKCELPIEKVSLTEVTGQYLECIKSLKYFDVEIAAEYLVIAATLLSVKASVLLGERIEPVPDENGVLVDPHEELVRRLQELQAFRAAAAHLADVPQLGIDVFAPPQKAIKIDPLSVPLADHQAEMLVSAFQKVLSKLGERSRSMSITLDTVSIVERMRSVVDLLTARGGRATFADVLANITDRISAVGTFVALLELTRRRMITVAQSEVFGTIELALNQTGLNQTALNQTSVTETDNSGAASEQTEAAA